MAKYEVGDDEFCPEHMPAEGIPCPLCGRLPGVRFINDPDSEILVNDGNDAGIDG